ncbi:MAG: hypothetical protein FJ146_11840 [Deltaproteobacteria bacterium]|nr:hypothetical protein [Deltaproteobacteria bacterium]
MLLPWSKKPLILGLGLALTLGCGRSRREIDTTMPPTVATPVLSLAPPLSFEIADPECQNGSGLATLTATEVRSWQGQVPVATTVSLTKTISTDTLGDEAIGLTTYGDGYQRSCDFRRGRGLRCQDASGRELMWRETSSGKSLKICRDAYAYPRLSHEAVALTSLYHLQTARSLYAAVSGPDSPLPAPLRLSVLPTFATDLAHYPIKSDDGTREGLVRTFVTDNLAYFPDAQMLAVFPIRESEANLLRGYYWESAFVLAHEYAHHIDLTRHASAMAALGLRWNPMLHSYVTDRTSARLTTTATTTRQPARLAGAMAEAFADLIGFYTAGAREDAVSGLPYIGRDRVVTQDQFRGGSPKTLTPERLDTLLGGGKLGDDLIDFGDIHAGGAVLAHALDQIFLQLTGTSSASRSPEEIKQHYQLALRFMDTYTALATASRSADRELSPGELLAPLGLAITQIGNDYLSSETGQATADPAKVKKVICEIMKDRVPALTTPPFAEDNRC